VRIEKKRRVFKIDPNRICRITILDIIHLSFIENAKFRDGMSSGDTYSVGPKRGTSYVDRNQMSRSDLKAEAKSSLRNVTY
jgi:hypothetical protein